MRITIDNIIVREKRTRQQPIYYLGLNKLAQLDLFSNTYYAPTGQHIRNTLPIVCVIRVMPESVIGITRNS